MNIYNHMLVRYADFVLFFISYDMNRISVKPLYILEKNNLFNMIIFMIFIFFELFGEF